MGQCETEDIFSIDTGRIVRKHVVAIFNLMVKEIKNVQDDDVDAPALADALTEFAANIGSVMWTVDWMTQEEIEAMEKKALAIKAYVEDKHGSAFGNVKE